LSADCDDALAWSFVFSADQEFERSPFHNIDCLVGLSGTIRLGAAGYWKDREPLPLGLCRHAQWKMQHARDDDSYGSSHRGPILPIRMAGC